MKNNTYDDSSKKITNVTHKIINVINKNIKQHIHYCRCIGKIEAPNLEGEMS